MKKEKTKLRVIQILCLVSLLITVFSIQSTYARYYEKIDTNYKTNIKRWVIEVNDSVIHRNETLNEIMEPVLRANTHMNSNNTLVPGREGYFEFEIDYTRVDLAFKFEFDLRQLNTKTVVDATTGAETQVNNHLEDFEIYGYSIIETDADSGEETETITTITPVNDMSKLTQIIDPSTDVDNNNNKKRVIRILFRWNDANADTADDADEDGMNNLEDTQYAGLANAEDSLHDILKYNVKITFTQYLGANGGN